MPKAGIAIYKPLGELMHHQIIMDVIEKKEFW